ncbi:hypothetical protein Tco_0637429 [Tanacetum coccineum]
MSLPYSPDMCDNDIQDDQNAVECDDERVALANLIANLQLDVEDNKKIQKQLKKSNASLAQELKIDYDKLEHKLKETLGLLAQKEIDIQEGLKVKAYEISVVKEKHDELVKQSLLTKSLRRSCPSETKVITDLKLKEEKDIDKMISKEIIDQALVKHSQDISRAPTAKDMEILIKTCLMPLALKTQNDSFAFVHELKQEMHADLKYNILNDVNARTKKPNVVPISTRKPKSQANKSVATHRKKTVASESTVQNSKSYYRMLYEKTSKHGIVWIGTTMPISDIHVLGDGILGKRDVLRMRATLRLTLLYGLPHVYAI